LQEICEDHIVEECIFDDTVTLCLNVGRGDPPPRIINYMETVIDLYSESEFQKNFRMHRQAFDQLQGLVRAIFLATETPTESLKRNLLAVIWLLATPDSFR
jgi:hypothetical protein